MPTAGPFAQTLAANDPVTLKDFLVITGCNSGIGHAFAQIAIAEGYHVHALDLTQGEKLEALKDANCEIDQLDVTNVDSIQRFKAKLGDKPVDLLLNVAGIAYPHEKDSLKTVTLQAIERTFAVNTYGPLLLTQALLPNVLAAPEPRRIAVVSSRVGSIADNSSGGSYAYRASKTAVNSFFKNIAVELKEQNVIVSILHPGITNTNILPGISSVPDVVEPEVPAKGLWHVLQTKGMSDTGRFWHRDDYELPW